jgi:hypothetical protein
MGEQWYYSSNGEQQGPVELPELQRLATSGQLQPSDLVWRQGMPLWIPAEDTRGLFQPQRGQYPAPPAPLAPQVVPVEPTAESPGAPAGPAPGRPAARPRARTPARMSAGAKVALFGALAASIVVVVVIVVMVVVSNRGPRGAVVHDRGTYTLNLNEKGRDVRFVRFAANRWVTISVTSDFQTDVDLYVFDDRGVQIAADTRPDPDCFVNFRAPRTGMYRIEIVNLGPGPNRSVVRYN